MISGVSITIGKDESGLWEVQIDPGNKKLYSGWIVRGRKSHRDALAEAERIIGERLKGGIEEKTLQRKLHRQNAAYEALLWVMRRTKPGSEQRMCAHENFLKELGALKSIELLRVLEQRRRKDK
jgi:hypothetical protein